MKIEVKKPNAVNTTAAVAVVAINVHCIFSPIDQCGQSSVKIEWFRLCSVLIYMVVRH